MIPQTQIEPPEYNYEISPQLDPYDTDSQIAGEILAGAFIGLIIAMVFWGVVLWNLPAKAGYNGAARWAWFLLMYFPLTGGLALLVFIFAPWPVKRKLLRAEAQLEELRRATQSRPGSSSGVDNELEELRRRMRNQ